MRVIVSGERSSASQPCNAPISFSAPSCFALKASARLHLVETAIQVELQQGPWMIAPPPSRCCNLAAKSTKVEFVDEHIDHPNGAVFGNVVVDAVRKQQLLLRPQPSMKRGICAPPT
jgi:hypothetical protein